MSAEAPFSNRLGRSLALLERVPAPLRTRARSLAIGRVVKFVGTAGLRIEELTPERACIAVRNRAAVQNHIGGVHAAAMTLLAETATGLVVGMNVPDDRVPVIKWLRVDFKRRSKGGMRAVATLGGAERALIRSTEKGELVVQCTVTDDSGAAPIEVQMCWAWTPKR